MCVWGGGAKGGTKALESSLIGVGWGAQGLTEQPTRGMMKGGWGEEVTMLMGGSAGGEAHQVPIWRIGGGGMPGSGGEGTGQVSV